MEKISKVGFAKYLKKFGGQYYKSFAVYEKEKILFMRPAKCAGSSLQYALTTILSKQIHQSKAGNVKWLNTITDEELEKYFVIAFVRNPWDKIVSISSYLSSLGPKCEIENLLTGRNLTQTMVSYSIPCHLFCYNNGIRFADFIGRFENLDTDFKECCKLAKINHIELKKLRVTPHKHYSKYYNDKLKNMVSEKYKLDIDMFNYKFSSEGS